MSVNQSNAGKSENNDDIRNLYDVNVDHLECASAIRLPQTFGNIAYRVTTNML